MELLTDPFLTASLALLLSFLVAKLVSFAMPHRDPYPRAATKNADQPITLQELQFTVQGSQSETEVQFPTQIQVSTNVEIKHRAAGEISFEPDVFELPVMSDIATAEVSGVETFAEESAGENTTEARVLDEETQEFGPQAVDSANLHDSAKQMNTEFIEEISIDSSAEPIVDGSVKERDEEIEVALDYEEDDDDWEGIERSELEKVFMAASEFVAGKNLSRDEDERLASIGSDVQMELYGLHKVATEGPCREPQPMALKLSARAKWNAWQKLGNMSPEVAMEQYITLLSDKVPGWTKDNSAGKSEQESRGSEVIDSAASDLSTSLSHSQVVETESELERKSGAQGCSLLTLSDSENNVKK